jgi:hypothetical protein
MELGFFGVLLFGLEVGGNRENNKKTKTRNALVVNIFLFNGFKDSGDHFSWSHW